MRFDLLSILTGGRRGGQLADDRPGTGSKAANAENEIYRVSRIVYQCLADR